MRYFGLSLVQFAMLSFGVKTILFFWNKFAFQFRVAFFSTNELMSTTPDDIPNQVLTNPNQIYSSDITNEKALLEAIQKVLNGNYKEFTPQLVLPHVKRMGYMCYQGKKANFCKLFK